jgi:hypothetical protein
MGELKMNIDGIDYTPLNISIANLCMNPDTSARYLLNEARACRDLERVWIKHVDASSQGFAAFSRRTALQYRARANALQQAAYVRSLESQDVVE